MFLITVEYCLVTWILKEWKSWWFYVLHYKIFSLAGNSQLWWARSMCVHVCARAHTYYKHLINGTFCWVFGNWLMSLGILVDSCEADGQWIPLFVSQISVGLSLAGDVYCHTGWKYCYVLMQIFCVAPRVVCGVPLSSRPLELGHRPLGWASFLFMPLRWNG